VLCLRTICAEPLQIDKKREESFIKAIFLSEEKSLVDKGRYQGENNYIVLLTMSNSEPLYATSSIHSNFLLSHNATNSLK
jgi:hypothetical protein